MKTITTLLAVLFATSALAGPMASDGLYTLATKGSGDMLAMEGKGLSFHKDGGMPGAFTYGGMMVPGKAQADALLNDGEFLAPHYFQGFDGKTIVMVAPHLLVDGMVMKKAGPDDSFIVIDGMGAERFDYSMDIAPKMM